MTDEISLKEFRDLPGDRKSVTKKESEIIQYIGLTAKSTPNIRDFLGVEHSTAYSRLDRLLDKGYLAKRYRGEKCFWALTKEGQKLYGGDG